MALPRISLITPSYNQGKFLRQTIESVLRQKYPNLEFLIVDGGSTDETIDILQSYGERIRWISEPDNGQTDALNKGFRQATGDIVGFLNSDDLLASQTLWEVAQLFQQNPKIGWITGDYQIISALGQPRDPLVRWYKLLQRQVFRVWPGLFPIILGVNNPLSQPSTFWRAKIHRSEVLREDLDLVMDYEWWWRLFSFYGPPKVVPYIWSYFRVHEDSKGGLYFRQRLEEQWQVAREYGVWSPLLVFHKFHNRVISWLYDQGIT